MQAYGKKCFWERYDVISQFGHFVKEIVFTSLCSTPTKQPKNTQCWHELDFKLGYSQADTQVISDWEEKIKLIPHRNLID